MGAFRNQWAERPEHTRIEGTPSKEEMSNQLLDREECSKDLREARERGGFGSVLKTFESQARRVQTLSDLEFVVGSLVAVLEE